MLDKRRIVIGFDLGTALGQAASSALPGIASAASGLGLPTPPADLMAAAQGVLKTAGPTAQSFVNGATAAQSGATPAQIAAKAATLPPDSATAYHAGAGVVQANAQNPAPPGLSPVQAAGHALKHVAAAAPVAHATAIHAAIQSHAGAASGAAVASTGVVGWAKTHPTEAIGTGLLAAVAGWFGWKRYGRHVKRIVRHG
jgi:hypothetical protein